MHQCVAESGMLRNVALNRAVDAAGSQGAADSGSGFPGGVNAAYRD